MLWVQELAKALGVLSGFRTVAVLVNSRTLIAWDHAEHLGIRKLNTEPAVELLHDKCNMPEHQWEPDLAQQLAELCGCNALCLTAVGSFIAAGRCIMEVRTCQWIKPLQTTAAKPVLCDGNMHQSQFLEVSCLHNQFGINSDLPVCLVLWLP